MTLLSTCPIATGIPDYQVYETIIASLILQVPMEVQE